MDRSVNLPSNTSDLRLNLSLKHSSIQPSINHYPPPLDLSVKP